MTFPSGDGTQKLFFFFFFEATGHSSRRSGWMARDEINTSSSGPILSFESTGFDPWNWKSSPPKWSAEAESSLFLQHSDATRAPAEKTQIQKTKQNRKTFSFKLSLVSYTLYVFLIFKETNFIQAWWCLAWTSLSHLLYGSNTCWKTLMAHNDT